MTETKQELKFDATGMLTLSQINAAIAPLRIDVHGLSACGFEPDQELCGGQYYAQEKLPLMREAFKARLAAVQQEVQPAFYTVVGKKDDGEWTPLPQYAAFTEAGVIGNVLAVARNEGYKGSGLERLMELRWVVRPVYIHHTQQGVEQVAEIRRLQSILLRLRREADRMNAEVQNDGDIDANGKSFDAMLSMFNTTREVTEDLHAKKFEEAYEMAGKGGCGRCPDACAGRIGGCRFVHESPSAADMDVTKVGRDAV